LSLALGNRQLDLSVEVEGGGEGRVVGGNDERIAPVDDRPNKFADPTTLKGRCAAIVPP
jgi:hypothetical protein